MKEAIKEMLDQYHTMIEIELSSLRISGDPTECLRILKDIEIYQRVVGDLYKILKSEL